ncbi:MAG: MaoC family dehydratase N-terminal domain-containing protein [Pseudomonadota bacterium]
MNSEEMARLQSWVGETQVQRQCVSLTSVMALAATLDCEWMVAENGASAPPLAHWLCFVAHPGASELDEDGHPRRGGFLPPVLLPRRMWAASEVAFHEPVCIGEELERVSRIDSVEFKPGRSGKLCFVTVSHEIRREGRLAIRERQQLVYRERVSRSSASARRAPEYTAQWTRLVKIDPVLLFRYSAITFNSHRIHYDRDYAVTREGYDGLVLQAPLAATLMVDALMKVKPQVHIAAFEFRALRPVFDGAEATVQGRLDDNCARIWILDQSGQIAVTATPNITVN